jgi:hypothetical protein
MIFGGGGGGGVGGEGEVTEYKSYFDFLYNCCVQHNAF